MKRPRLRRIAKWTGGTACVLLAAAWGLSAFGFVEWANDRYMAIIGEGLIMLVQVPITPHEDFLRPIAFSAGTFADSRLTWLPLYRNGGGRVVGVPLWIPFLMVAIPTAFLFYRDRPRPAPGCCQACGYDLTANISGVCPECGREF